MKLRILTITMGILTASAAWAEKIEVLSCQVPNRSFAHFSVPKGMGAIGHIIYNYSSATVSCPLNAPEVIEKNGSVKCFGSWAFDNVGKSTMAWVEIVNDGRRITAKTQTNHLYGSQILNMICELKLQENYR